MRRQQAAHGTAARTCRSFSNSEASPVGQVTRVRRVGLVGPQGLPPHFVYATAPVFPTRPTTPYPPSQASFVLQTGHEVSETLPRRLFHPADWRRAGPLAVGDSGRD